MHSNAVYCSKGCGRCREGNCRGHIQFPTVTITPPLKARSSPSVPYWNYNPKGSIFDWDITLLLRSGKSGIGPATSQSQATDCETYVASANRQGPRYGRCREENCRARIQFPTVTVCLHTGLLQVQKLQELCTCYQFGLTVMRRGRETYCAVSLGSKNWLPATAWHMSNHLLLHSRLHVLSLRFEIRQIQHNSV